MLTYTFNTWWIIIVLPYLVFLSEVNTLFSVLKNDLRNSISHSLVCVNKIQITE